MQSSPPNSLMHTHLPVWWLQEPPFAHKDSEQLKGRFPLELMSNRWGEILCRWVAISPWIGFGFGCPWIGLGCPPFRCFTFSSDVSVEPTKNRNMTILVRMCFNFSDDMGVPQSSFPVEHNNCAKKKKGNFASWATSQREVKFTLFFFLTPTLGFPKRLLLLLCQLVSRWL